jgi:hypothetical protein
MPKVHSRTRQAVDADEDARNADKTASAQRAIQKKIDRSDKSAGAVKNNSGAMQAGARLYPEPPFPKQHQRKPGEETALDPAPMFDAPYYKGSEKLAGMVALISGGDSGIGRAVAVLFVAAQAASVPLSKRGDATFAGRLSVPTDCASPVVLVRERYEGKIGGWLAASGQ